ncbi:MAG: S1C family serine protease, partial [Planctomycetota bacterium]
MSLNDPTPAGPVATPPSGEAASGLLVTFLGTALAASLLLVAALRLRPEWFGAVVEVPGEAPPAAPEVRLFGRVERSVVHITTRGNGVTRAGRFQVDVPRGTGSGIVWDEDGHIVTCDHLIDEGVRRAIVTLWDGIELEARLVWRSPKQDIAVLRIEPPPSGLFPAVRRGADEPIEVGEAAFAVACPYGLLPTLSGGIVSGLGRRIETPQGYEIDQVLVTDAPLHPGTSGGGLFDAKGRVIGMNAAIQEDERSLLGLGFAQPIDRVEDVVPGLIEDGLTWFPELGFLVARDVDSAWVLERIRGEAQPGVAIPDGGLLVREVDPGGPAARAGLRPMNLFGDDVQLA